MPDLRPRVASETVLTLLNQHFSTPILDLTPIEGVEVARVLPVSCRAPRKYRALQPG